MSNKVKDKNRSKVNVNQQVEFEEIDGAGASDIELNGVEKLQNFIDKNKNAVLSGLVALLLIIGGTYYYKNIYAPQAEMAASEEMFEAEYYFEKDSFELALNAPGGFLDIIENHGGTKAGNLAQYYAGLSYFQLGKYTDAIGHLKSFSTKDPVLGALSLGVLADAQMENGDVDEALNSYKKAANFSNNEASAPVMLKKAGLAFETNGNAKQALEFYTKIKTNFPKSSIANDIDKYIGRAKAKI